MTVYPTTIQDFHTGIARIVVTTDSHQHVSLADTVLCLIVDDLWALLGNYIPTTYGSHVLHFEIHPNCNLSHLRERFETIAANHMPPGMADIIDISLHLNVPPPLRVGP